MTALDAEDREALESAVRGVLSRRSSSQQVRHMTAGDGRDPALWEEMSSLGWPSLVIPEKFGGAEAGLSAASVVLTELGAFFTPSPYLSSAVLAPTVLLAGSNGPAEEWLPLLATGDATGAIALTAPAGRLHPGLFSVAAKREGEGFRLTGRAHFTLDGDADVLVVGATSDEGPVLAAVSGNSTGISTESIPSIDRTRRLVHVDFDGVSVGRDMVIATGTDADSAVDALVGVAGFALAADAVGAAQTALDMANEYAKQRVQFGRVIGSFQAIKHKLADMYVLVEASKATIRGAAASYDQDAPDARRRLAAAGAFVRASASRVVGDAMQTHGGIGYTWEHDCHFLMKRAKFDEFFLTDLWSQRKRLAEAWA